MKYLVATNNFPGVNIKTNQITGGHETKMLSQWVHPDIVLKLWVTDGDVAGHAFSEAFAGEVPEDRRCVDEDVLPVLGVR